LDAYYIFQEEREPWERAIALLKADSGNGSKAELETLMEANTAYLSKYSAPRAKALSTKFKSFQQMKIDRNDMMAEIAAVFADPPPGFFPEEKLIRTIETVRKSGGRGIMIFSATHIFRNKLWGGLEKAYSFSARPAHEVLSESPHLSIRVWRELQKNRLR
jgi:hypothetical protein